MTYALMWVGFGAYVGLLVAAPSLDRRLVWGVICTLLLAFAVAPPLLSHDVYSYIDYARLGVVHGLNPYVHAPAAAPADPAFTDVEWRHTTSVYGPLFTLLTYPLAWLSVGLATWVLKALAAAAVLAIALLLARLAPARGIDPRRAAAFVALNPLVLVHVVGGAHNDAVAMLLATLGVAMVLSARETAGGAAFAAALAIKTPVALAAPFALIGTHRTTNEPPTGRKRVYISRFRPIGRLLLGATLALAAIALAAYLAFGWHWLDALTLVAQRQGKTSHLSIPTTFARITGLDSDSVRTAALTLYAVFFMYLLAWTWRGGDWVRAAAWASSGLLLATAWLLPWYLIWALPLAALSRDRPLQLLLLALTAFQLAARL
ncbi:MAG: polyprenol phosphomannose-dependent alpha 1,6 mannosyltransferase MptB [Solirubrobacterales bacterium]